ncbi:hypothetical protein [Halapricum sp. CBA1109]|uniref:hypothetical protein n=1 Tax=Halapricum sp. CBA1109 TaxID=2668068 RepID=UPI001E62CB1E|nr:hypothetical protein [Halapricum sp. CBA1109]
MTTVVVPADPPFEGVVLQELVDSTPLSAADASASTRRRWPTWRRPPTRAAARYW